MALLSERSVISRIDLFVHLLKAKTLQINQNGTDSFSKSKLQKKNCNCSTENFFAWAGNCWKV